MKLLQECLAKNIKKYRRIQGISQVKLAEMADVSATYIALLEKGRRFPSLQVLHAIAAALKIDDIDLFDKSILTNNPYKNSKKELRQKIEQVIDEVFDNTDKDFF
ncbi:MAG: helix-turn-helix domain-containing protein [Treponemataceae bacterium]